MSSILHVPIATIKYNLAVETHDTSGDTSFYTWLIKKANYVRVTVQTQRRAARTSTGPMSSGLADSFYLVENPEAYMFQSDTWMAVLVGVPLFGSIRMSYLVLRKENTNVQYQLFEDDVAPMDDRDLVHQQFPIIVFLRVCLTAHGKYRTC